MPLLPASSRFQFFFTIGKEASPHLDGKYVAFGQVRGAAAQASALPLEQTLKDRAAGPLLSRAPLSQPAPAPLRQVLSGFEVLAALGSVGRKVDASTTQVINSCSFHSLPPSAQPGGSVRSGLTRGISLRPIRRGS